MFRNLGERWNKLGRDIEDIKKDSNLTSRDENYNL